jgi:hypothetical protein
MLDPHIESKIWLPEIPPEDRDIQQLCPAKRMVLCAARQQYGEFNLVQWLDFGEADQTAAPAVKLPKASKGPQLNSLRAPFATYHIQMAA